MNLRYTILAALPFIGSVGAHSAQVHLDPVRHASASDLRQIFVPVPEATRLASFGFDMVVADLFWVRTVLMFVDLLDQESGDGAGLTRAVLKTVGTLDPVWRTPFFYGGGMLRMLDDVEGSDDIYTDGMEAFPEDAYFPFSLAMNAYLLHEDIDSAVEYMTQAAALPEAPAWYRNAAAGFLSRKGQRKAALMYLKEQGEQANSDRERQIIQSKYNQILYAQMEEVLSERQEKWEAHFRRPLESVAALAPLPPDPLGGEWFLSPDGVVISTVAEPILARQARNEERTILVNP